MLNNTLTYLRQNNLYNGLAKELVGSNIPNLVLSMNTFERLDQLVIGGGNLLNFYGVNQILSRAYDQLAHHWLGPVKSPDRAWRYHGKSAFLYGQILSYMLAVPALRNAFMAKVSGTTRFVDMVGLNGKRKESPDTLRAYINHNVVRFIRWYMSGLAGSIALGLLALRLSKHNVPIPSWLHSAQQWVGVPKGAYKNIPDKATVLFAAYPAYLGWWLNSRDDTERREILVKAAWFGMSFTVLPRKIEQWAMRLFKNTPKQQTQAFLIHLGSSILLASTLPATLNLLLRKRQMPRTQPAPNHDEVVSVQVSPAFQGFQV